MLNGSEDSAMIWAAFAPRPGNNGLTLRENGCIDTNAVLCISSSVKATFVSGAEELSGWASIKGRIWSIRSF